MNQFILGQKMYCTDIGARLTEENEKKMHLIIETVTASKFALCEYLRKFPTADQSEAFAVIEGECNAIATVNDHLGIGIPMNSVRLTLKAAAHHYYNNIVPEVAYHQFRIGAFYQFIEQNLEVLLAFPEVHGQNVYVGDLRFTVNSMNAKPTFLQFSLPDLTKASAFYTIDASHIKSLSEYAA